MVVRVYGVCNGQAVIFTRDDPTSDAWTATVPAVESGRYIVELYAVDDADNSTYLATVLMIWDASLLRTTFQVIRIGENWSLGDVESILCGSARNATLKTVKEVRI